eukprot:4548244-Amphidinium_carterae.1
MPTSQIPLNAGSGHEAHLALLLDQHVGLVGHASLSVADCPPQELQQALVADGMKLVTLPKEVLLEYEAALGKPRTKCDPLELG